MANVIATRKVYNKHDEFFGHATIYEGMFYGEPLRYTVIHDLGNARGDEVSDAAVHQFEREHGVGTDFVRFVPNNSFD